ncbi:Ribonuclease HII protein [Marine Group I thaumarchaeote SCGC AAA799-E16]|uniref:Ribonuclease HII n=4 Tax=Marine Group I TaxID=905826 RepID=A0A081RNG9_9ARCH|nr:Ribonuclease HII protein [Marine Group I thaumarchaeote SCGC AAA799-N04]KER06324.1 Ribonuclease HII protein [Marine Group I thaumarchaeote SCGC AAA799-E16]KFM15451.1 Ribonuclease HII protein [Marine Group I thaumarchaeote SCGC AAA799-D11]KFM16692.1 Ribonuclease HII protein [Marine Group I thaumarchaeote SCGC RSA3]
MRVCGIDDAGRGSMLGPLVISGISIDKRKLRKLSSLGVKDSKKLSPKNRELLYKKIIKLVDDYYITKIPPRSIDASVKRHGLNELEAKYMAKVVSKLNPDTSYVDSCDVNPKRFGKEISKLSDNHKIKSYHHADSRFVIVSAASILAKVTRDRAIKKLRKNHDLGSGYPSDLKTVKFVTRYYKTNHSLPTFVRKSWKPVQKIMNT